MQNDPKLMERAVKSGNLQERSRGNQAYGTADFGAWTKKQIDSIQFSSVVDICCGTGNQLVQYAVRPRVNKMVGVDLSEESLALAKQRLIDLKFTGESQLIQCPMEDYFEREEVLNRKVDLISCFYGLYYATDVKALLAQAVDHLTHNGQILIVGPYGDNNSSIFKLLTKYFALPELVSRSATTFMEHEAVSFLKETTDVRLETFINRIEYPTSESVMDYWQSSTFYSEEFHQQVQHDIEKVFKESGSFVIEKHVMACFARKL